MKGRRANQVTGRIGEQLGEAYLTGRGYRILERNVRTPFGEIDLVAQDRSALAFIEIKTRRSVRFGHPEEAVTAAKQRRMARLAAWYAQRFRPEPSIRFDVLAIQLGSSQPEIRLIQNAFEVS